jgi:malate dehydrogenase (quinone)
MYDIAIVGGGVTGTALLYALTCHSDVKSVILLERREGVARVNSSAINNSQTLHDGGIETNFTLEKALNVKDGAELLSGYLERHAPGAFIRLGKMVIAVGAEEVTELRERFRVFSPHFPHLELIGRERIAELEPKVMEGRGADEPIVALYSKNGKAVNYQQLSETFRDRSARSGKGGDVLLEREVTKIERRDDAFVLTTERGEIRARAVAVCAGGVSLNFAHGMGYAKEFTLLPVAGSFYRANGLLNGKVYTVQLPKIPFAAVHGDPAVYDRAETRFGPTALPLPMIERHRWSTVGEFIKSGALRLVSIWSLIRVLWDADIARFAFRNFLYEFPCLGKWLFLRKARKIVPTLRMRDLKLARGAGGIRSQLVDTTKMALAKGMDKIVGEGIIFTMAPSPGASYCLKNAMEDAERLTAYLGDCHFDAAGMRAELTGVRPETFHEGVLL